MCAYAVSCAAPPQAWMRSAVVRLFGLCAMAAYSQHSSTWPMANVEAIASEYTSAQWDGKFVFLWSDLMYLAYDQIKLGRVL